MTRRLGGWLLLILVPVCLLALSWKRAPREATAPPATAALHPDAQSNLAADSTAALPNSAHSESSALSASPKLPAPSSQPESPAMADEIARVRAALGPVVPGDLPPLTANRPAAVTHADWQERTTPAAPPELAVTQQPERPKIQEPSAAKALRTAARSLDEVAAALEDEERFEEADRLREASRWLRQSARPGENHPSAPSGDKNAAESVENECRAE
ncbi:MAG: hypothetical protein ACKPEY_17535 [Planctomycetota bacterium]